MGSGFKNILQYLILQPNVLFKTECDKINFVTYSYFSLFGNIIFIFLFRNFSNLMEPKV